MVTVRPGSCPVKLEDPNQTTAIVSSKASIDYGELVTNESSCQWIKIERPCDSEDLGIRIFSNCHDKTTQDKDEGDVKDIDFFCNYPGDEFLLPGTVHVKQEHCFEHSDQNLDSEIMPKVTSDSISESALNNIENVAVSSDFINDQKKVVYQDPCKDELTKDKTVLETKKSDPIICGKNIPVVLEKDKSDVNVINYYTEPTDLTPLKSRRSNIRGERSHSCAFCQARFRYRCHLNRHEQIHTGVKPFSCAYCDARFNAKSKVKRHERTHTGERPYSCSFCLATFPDKGDLSRHERIHTGERPYNCTFCNFKFTTKGNLDVHERGHTGEKPYNCPICNARFGRKNNLDLHMRVHTGEKPYTCSHCGAKFTQNSSMRKHERTAHTDKKSFTCSVCGARFRLKSEIDRHSRTHSGKMYYSCAYCDSTFTTKGSLVVHERIHINGKPFQCILCGAKFRDKWHLNRHEHVHGELSLTKSNFEDEASDNIRNKLYHLESPGSA